VREIRGKGFKGAFGNRFAVLLSFMAKFDPDLNLVFQALSDPTRRAMLAALGKGAVPVSDLARPTGLALPTVMRHLGVLEAAGLIASEKQGRVRTCRMRPETLGAAVDWLSQQRSLWEARADRLEDYVMRLMAEGGGDDA
jgi:DNA-binding transcriptional ArsR family regulator